MRKNPNSITVLCHRVIKSVETLGGYFGKTGTKRKKELLTKEKANIKF